MTAIFCSILCCASLVWGQEWRWDRYDGTFWHQAADLPPIDMQDAQQSYYRSGNVGDFDGNGRDEITGVNLLTYRWEATTDLQHWDEWTYTGIPWYGDRQYLYASALNLDEDPQDELIFYWRLLVEPYTDYVAAFDPDDSTPPAFTARPDLLESLAYPAWPAPTMFGDLDGDGLLDGITPLDTGWLHYERNGSVWTIIDTLDVQPFGSELTLLAADINSDGDTEFGYYQSGIDCNCLMGEIIDFADGVTNVFPTYGDVLLYPGDYDGDGNVEAFMEGGELSLPSRIVRLSEGVPYNYEELVNQWEPNSPVVFSTESNGQNRIYSFYNGQRLQIGSWTMVPAGYTLQWSDSGWSLAGDGSWYGHVYEGNTADMDGDGDREYIYRMLVADWFGPDRVVWSMGSGDLSRFFDNADTVFTNPRIGDVEGDGRGELVTRVAAGAPIGIYFYELERVGNNYVAHLRPELSQGLPVNATEFTLADLDNDGQAELFINTGFWRSFFRRNGQWEEYTGILPNGIGLNLYFADFNGDGDLDVFSQNGVWISLSPTNVKEPDILQPSSFSLSAYPNPFNAQSTISFTLPRAGEASLKLFDLLGREVRTLVQEPRPAGSYQVSFDAAGLPSGMYFTRLEAGGLNSTRKLLLLK